MLETMRCPRGAVSAPHHLAAETALRVLRDGGNAVEAMVAAAATIAVAYPHMNSLGGDNFWLIKKGDKIFGIDACGRASENVSAKFYSDRGYRSIPSRGPLSALTVAGALSGWDLALQISSKFGGSLPLDRLLEDAFFMLKQVCLLRTRAWGIAKKASRLKNIPGFSETFVGWQTPKTGARFTLSVTTLKHLSERGLQDFYTGKLSRKIAFDLSKLDSPVSLDDLKRHEASIIEPLEVPTSIGTLYNMPPPTQGIASLIILSLFDMLEKPEPETADYIHVLLEATKAAFGFRQAWRSRAMDIAERYLRRTSTHGIEIDLKQAKPWKPKIDLVIPFGWELQTDGRVVRFIQSIYWEFGSGLVLPETGIVWHNRGVSFSLDERHHNCLEPMRKPFHTIQPAMAKLRDGRIMAYGTMGGEGQPQTQAALFSRYAVYQQDLQTAINAPRWLLGKTWGDDSNMLRLESRIEADVVNELKQRGHVVEVVGSYDDIMGHAGAVVVRPDGIFEAASDPRSDGAATGF